MKKRVLSALFAAILLCTGCSTAPASSELGSDTSDAAETVETQTETETDRSQTKDNLPEGLDLGGITANILYRGCPVDVIEIYAEDLTGEPVSDAIYNRNLAVAERLNCSFHFIPSGTGTADNFPQEARSSIIAGSDDYSFISWNQFSLLPLCLENMILDIHDAPYLDLSMPWWNQDYMEILQIGEQKRFYLMGDICLNALRVTASVFFNGKLYEDTFGKEISTLYNQALEGSWTLETMRTLSESAYQDVNGDGKVNEGDIFGIAATVVANTELFAYGAGLRVIEKDSADMPTLVIQNEHNYNILDRLNQLYWNNTGMYNKYDDTAVFNSDKVCQVFAADELLFLPSWLKTCEYLRDMDSTYGILPYPKYDESQEYYISTVQDTASTFCIPVSCQSGDEVCAILEAMCAENYRTVIPAYYEVALKRQYARDDLSAQMIDLIHDTSSTDFAYAYNYSIGSIGTIMRDVVRKNGSMASAVEKSIGKSETALAKLIETYTSVE